MSVRLNYSRISWVLGILTLCVLLLNIPTDIAQSLPSWLLLAALVAFTLNMNVLLSTGTISAAHLFGIMAFLILSSERDIANALWAVATGSLLGSLIQVARAAEWMPRRRMYVRRLDTVFTTIAQHTLSLLTGSLLYSITRGHLPLDGLSWADALPVTAFSAGYLLVYMPVLMLRFRLDGARIAIEDRLTVASMMLVPIPFAVLGAVVSTNLDYFSWTILVAGLTLVVIGIYGLSRTQYHYRQQVNELSSLSVVSQALRSDLNLNVLLETIYQQVTDLLNIDDFTVAFYDPLQQTVTFPLVMQQGQRTLTEPRQLGTTLLDYVIDKRMPLLIERNVNNVAMKIGADTERGPVYSWIGVPLLAGDQPLGAIIGACSDPDHQLGPADQRLLMNIAAQASVAIENAQLYAQSQQRAEQLATLNSISQLLTGTLSQERVLNLLTSSIVAVVNCDAVALYIQRDNTLMLARNLNLSPRFGASPPIPLILREANTDAHNVLLVSDSHTDARVLAEHRAIADIEGKRAWLEIKLVSGDTVHGIIVAFFNTPRPFDFEEIQLIRAFTVQAGLAFNNAQLYTTADIALEQRINQIQAMDEIGRELISTLNLQKIFSMVLDHAVNGTGTEAGALVVRESNSTEMTVVTHRGYPPGVFDSSAALVSSITANVLETGQSIMLSDINRSQRYRALNSATRSQLSVPILHKSETLGVITLESTRADTFSVDDLNFVTQLATQAAIAIENARLFRRIAAGRDRLQAILDNMTEAVLLVDNDGTVALANPRVEGLLGIAASDLTGKKVFDLLLDSGSVFAARTGFIPGELRLLITDLRSGQWLVETGFSQHTYELQQPTHIYINRRIGPVRDENGQLLGILMVFLDETEQQELAMTREDLSRMIVHDLRSPLTAVTASLKLLNDLVPRDSDFTPIVQRTTKASMRAVRKLLNLVDSLLDIAKMESGKFQPDREPVTFYSIVDNVVLEMETLARELDVKLHVKIPDSLPMLDIDAEQIERVLLNLVDNALKFTPAFGEVAITAETTCENGQSMVRVQVSDTGPGVADDFKERLFSRFVQVEAVQGRRRGTGLGLSFCRLATEAHGGKIWVEDNPAGGAIFILTLPALNERGN